MIHSYRRFQLWDQWLENSYLGAAILLAENKCINAAVANQFGKQLAVIGVASQAALVDTVNYSLQTYISTVPMKKNLSNYIEADFYHLPILTGSIDLVLLPHTLEFVDNPRKVLAEACRIVKPEGTIIITGFNPHSLWGLRKIIYKKACNSNWKNNFIYTRNLINWLKLLDFELEASVTTHFRPPIDQALLYDKLAFLEYIGKTCFPTFGGIYFLKAKAKVIPLTPIRMKWQQQLSGACVKYS